MSITRKIADAAEYMAGVPKRSFTIGGLMPTLTNGQFRPRVMDMNRAGRIVERAIFVAGITAGVAGCVVEGSVFPMLLIVPLTKLAGYMGGGITHFVADKFSDLAQGIDRRATQLGKMLGNTAKNQIGISNAGNDPERAERQRVARELAADHAERKRKKPGLFDRGILHGLANTMDWLNEPCEGKYTIGAALRKITGQEPSEHGLHLSRLGRLSERAITLSVGAFVIASTMGGPLLVTGLMLFGAKVAGAGGGYAVEIVGKVAGGAMHALDGALNKPRRDPIGARPSEAVNTSKNRPAPQMQPNEPESALSQQRSIVGAFQQSAARPEQAAPGTGVGYSPQGPRARENFNFDNATTPPANSTAKPQQRQQGM